MTELSDLYQEVVLDHGRRPRNFGPLEGATNHAEGLNPLCGDHFTVHARVDAGVVRAYASAENVPSIRVAEKVGMRLIERVEHRYGDEVWFGVRYELRREDA